MVEFMAKLRERITVGVVGGSDLPKQKEQLGESGEGKIRDGVEIEDFDYMTGFWMRARHGGQSIASIGVEHVEKI